MAIEWKKEFKATNFLPKHTDPETFVTSQWQLDKDSPSYIYVFFRLAIFVAFFTIWILTYTMETSAGKPRWPIYLTNWGMTLCVFQSFLACLMLTCALLGTKVWDSPDLTETVMKLYPAYWTINVMATVVAFSISFVYWTIIYKATGSYWSTMNFMVHGFNSVLMFFDFCLVAHPVRLLHFIYPIFLTLAYVTMTAIFYACGGTTKDGSKYIYPILKWDQPGITIAYCLGITILMTAIHTVTFLLYKARNKIAELCFGVESEKNEYMYNSSAQTF